MTDTKALIVVFVIIILVGVFQLSTIRDGHTWGDDFSMYIHHAKNLVEGIPYGKIGLIQNPDYQSLAPMSGTTPPVYPLLLVPVYAAFGLNLSAMKVELILFFMLTLLMIYLTLRRELPLPYILLMIAALGFNPFFWDSKDQVISDIPFLFFLYLSFYIASKTYEDDSSPRRRMLYGVLLGLTVYLAYGTRSVGIFILPPLWIYELFRYRRPRSPLIAATVLSALLIFMQGKLIHSDAGYADIVQFNFGIVWKNLYLYARSMTEFWGNGWFKPARYFICIAMTGCAGYGLYRRIRAGMTHLDLFFFLYLVFMLVWQFNQRLRYLMPILPLYVFYAFIGIHALAARTSCRFEKGLVSMIMLVIAASYAMTYATMGFGPINEGMGRAETQELFDYIRQHTDTSDVFVFRKPRALSLYTDRAAAIFHKPDDDRKLFGFMEKIGADYLVTGPFNEDYLPKLIERHKERFSLEFENADFRMFRFKAAE